MAQGIREKAGFANSLNESASGQFTLNVEENLNVNVVRARENEPNEIG